jgi:hypothetical protein
MYCEAFSKKKRMVMLAFLSEIIEITPLNKNTFA